MKRKLVTHEFTPTFQLVRLGAVALLMLGLAVPAVAQKSSANVYYPPSSIERPQDLGKFAHTNYVLYSANGARPMGTPAPPPGVETPSSLQCLFGLISSPSGQPYLSCNVAALGTRHAKGGWGAIALVDAFDDPTAASDLASFASQYGLPTPDFTVVKVDTAHGYSTAGCANVPADQGWALEESLDIEWSFAMAETAKIYLVEACSNSYVDLMLAELAAGQLVEAAGGGDISNSYGGGEFGGETTLRCQFLQELSAG